MSKNFDNIILWFEQHLIIKRQYEKFLWESIYAWIYIYWKKSIILFFNKITYENSKNKKNAIYKTTFTFFQFEFVKEFMFCVIYKK